MSIIIKMVLSEYCPFLQQLECSILMWHSRAYHVNLVVLL